MTRFWVEPAGDADAQAAVATTAVEAGADTLVTDDDAIGRLARIHRRARGPTGITGDAGEVATVTIATPADQESAKAFLGRARYLVVETTDWTVIPWENLIAWARGTGTEIIAAVTDADQAALALTTLETGVDGVLLRTDDPAAVRAVGATVHGAQGPRLTLTHAEITGIEPVRMGDRVCVDTVAMLGADEGLLVGSSAGFLFLVGSEAADSAYVAARPFRVNAGAVHAYVLGPGGRTRYLSELGAGTEVLIADTTGATRSVAVGRCKIERRPMLLVHAKAGPRRGSVILQNAETIKVLTPKGPRSVVDLAVGDTVLVHEGDAARHFGVAVDETIEER